jgi:glycosyltransferase involved in cell wall biosynthesis
MARISLARVVIVSSMPRFSIVLPCYNEAETLPSIFARFAETIGTREDIEVLFVDNGSRDDSSTVIAQELKKPCHRFARVVTVPTNLGYGNGILSGLKEARGDFIGWTHADSQYDPKIVLDGFALLAAATNPSGCFLQGRRIGRNLFDAFFTAAMTLTARAMLGADVRDINAQPKLFPRAFLDHMRNPPKDFSLDLYALFLARRNNYKMIFLPVVFGQRQYGEAKGGGSLALKWKLTRRTWRFMRQLGRDIRHNRL